MAKVSLIRPHNMIAVSTPASPTCPPIGLAYIAASVRQAGHDVSVVDAVGEAPNQFLKMDDARFVQQGLSLSETLDRIPLDAEVIGISCMYSYEWPNVRKLIYAIRERCPKARIILGGEHSSAMPEFCLTDCLALDVAAIGEGEETMIELCDLSKSYSTVNGIVFRGANGPEKTPGRKRIKAIDDIPKPAWDIFPINNYLDKGYGRGVNRGRNMPLISSRGCPYRCTFCSNESMWGPQWISRNPELVLAEIREYIEKYQITNFDFYDLTTIVNRTWTVKFCKLIIDSGLKFTWQLASGTRSEAIDEEVATLLGLSGCSNITYAPESGSQAVVERIRKKIDLSKMKKSMRSAVKSGVVCKANILIGFPGEKHSEIFQSFKFIVEAAATGIHDLSVYPFSPYPGTVLYEQLRAENRIPEINDDYFLTLALSTELGAKPPSFSENISTRTLGIYRFVGIGLFYATSYLMHPVRVYKLIKNVVFSKEQETLLESVLHDKFFRRSKAKSAQ
ncbi:MAG: Radical domain protein [Pseudobdellovibrio sp.]|nr:Radical domain protein [Pseudobdellovibrio sp.]